MAESKHPFDILHQCLPPVEEQSSLLFCLTSRAKCSLRQSCKAGLRVVDAATTSCFYDETALDAQPELRLRSFQVLQRLRSLSNITLDLEDTEDDTRLLQILPLVGATTRRPPLLIAPTLAPISNIKTVRISGSSYTDSSICAIGQAFPQLQRLYLLAFQSDVQSVAYLPACLTLVRKCLNTIWPTALLTCWPYRPHFML